VGDPGDAQRLIDVLDHPAGSTPCRLVAVVPIDQPSTLDATIDDEAPTSIVILDHDCTDEQLRPLLDIARRRRIRLQVRGEHLGEEPVCLLPGSSSAVFAVHPSHIRRGQYALKRVFDVVVATLLLILLAPFFAVIAVLSKISSPGPVFYVSWRMGVCETPFPCFKFRTMCVGADVQQEELESRNEADGCLFKIADDPRVTRVGRFLRRTSLDELPQLANVLLGKMSLVGPRPLPLRDVRLMDSSYKLRHAVLPGMTGLWQVSGRSLLRASDMMELDVEYIRTWSLLLDLRILARTFAVVLTGKGAC
jgi:lipopolysaccharide/colanic/teichoic acid biosynthesis glycosyltransferase